MAHAGSDHALMGGSALVTGCVAARADAHGEHSESRFPCMVAALRRYPVVASRLGCSRRSGRSVWDVAAWSIPGAFTGIDNAVGWTAQTVRQRCLASQPRWRRGSWVWEERFGTPAAAGAIERSHVLESFQLAKVKAQYASGDRDAALATLQRQVERSPGHRDAVMQWFVWAVEELEPERAAAGDARADAPRTPPRGGRYGVWRSGPNWSITCPRSTSMPKPCWGSRRWRSEKARTRRCGCCLQGLDRRCAGRERGGASRAAWRLTFHRSWRCSRRVWLYPTRRLGALAGAASSRHWSRDSIRERKAGLGRSDRERKPREQSSSRRPMCSIRSRTAVRSGRSTI